MDPDFSGVPADTRTIPRDRLNIDNKARSNPFPWNGQFSPQLIEALLDAHAPRGSFVLDPFLGGGTVLCEAARLGHPGFGSEINPAAYKMAEVYRFINLKKHERKGPIEQAEELIYDALPDAPLFPTGKRQAPIQESLPRTAAVAGSGLAKILLDALVVLLDFGDEPLASDDVLRVWKRLRATVVDLPYSEPIIDLVNRDARALPLPDGAVDFVLTSPPYINVFNYHQNYRRSVESLGWDLLKVARSEIGSNRKHRQNRFLTVTQYCLDMASAFHELRRVCRPEARVVIVLGRESNVRKTSFFNGEIVARLATRSCGCRLESRQERVFQNRFGAMIHEDILHFTFGTPTTDPPTATARQTLTEALSRAPRESVADLKDAIDRVEEVKPSPVYGDSAPQKTLRKPREAV